MIHVTGCTDNKMLHYQYPFYKFSDFFHILS